MKPDMTEKQFQDIVVDLAMFWGWKVHHVRPGMTAKGFYMTAVQGHVGFPDLVLAHEGREGGHRRAMLPAVLFAELKSPAGRLSDAQKDWGRVLATVPGVEYHLWRPDDLERIAARLEGHPWQEVGAA